MGKKFRMNLNRLRNLEGGKRNCNCGGGRSLGCRGKNCKKIQSSQQLYKRVKKSIKFL